MPTERPRLAITETDDVAAERRPETPSRRELLRRLVEQRRSVIERDEQAEHRREAIRRSSDCSPRPVRHSPPAR